MFPAIFTGLYILLAIHIMKGIKKRVKLMEERILKSHKISLFNRSSGIISGVKEVISFDPNAYDSGRRTACNKTYSRKRGGGDRRTGIQHGVFG